MGLVEVQKIADILRDKREMHFFTENCKNNIESIFLNKFNIMEFEKPDVIIETETRAILLEHFEFDSSVRNRKGSASKREVAQVERDFHKEASSNHKHGKSEVYFRASYEENRSIEWYVDNHNEIFDAHYRKLESYKKHYIEEVGSNKEIEFGFLIENTSLLNDILINKQTLLVPFYIEELLSFYIKKAEVKHIFYIADGNLFYFSNDALSHSLIKLRKDFFVRNDEIINWKPNTLCFSLLID